MTFLAHVVVGPNAVWRTWPFDPVVTLAVFAAAIAYGVGVRRLRRARSAFRRAAAFASGLFAIAVALLTPLHAMADTLFSAHMTQHLLLMVVAAPLLVIGRPIATILAAMPPAVRRTATRARAAIGATAMTRTLRRPLVAWGVVTVAVWSWHAPTPYEAALAYEPFHAVEHASFLLASMLTWSVALRVGRRDASRALGRALFLAASALQGALLGAVLLFASSPLYPVHADGPALWGMTALEDQQLAGALMWIPPSAVYLGAIAAVLFAAFRTMEREQNARVGAVG
jgi:putative membrane protein